MQFSDIELIYMTVIGSQAYGTSTPESDVDKRGIFVAPINYKLGFLNRVESCEAPGEDTIAFEIAKFMSLAADCNPNIIEMLFTADEDVIHCDERGALLRENRDLFISEAARQSFTGYARSQLARIQRHKKWIERAHEMREPTREEYGLPPERAISNEQYLAAESVIRKKMDSWAIDFDQLPASTKIYIERQISDYLTEISVAAGYLGDRDILREMSAATLIGFDTNFIEMIEREKRYRAAKRDWKSFLTWKQTRNEARAELEKKFGYDTKHGMHLVRLLRMGKEILTEGKVKVKRPDADELLAIRLHGKWTLDELVEWAERADKELSTIVMEGRSVVPKKVNKKKIDELCIQITEMSYA